MPIPIEVLAMLACPVCRGRLRLELPQGSPESILCEGCGRRYPVDDGIPVLIPQRATL